MRPNDISWVEENTTLRLRVRVTAHPKPSLKIHSFKSGTNPMIDRYQLYPYVYVATYEMKKSLRSYCGKSVIFHAENSLGSAAFTTLIMVKCKLFRSIDL